MKLKSKKIAFVSLGCDKNRIDSERALYLLADAGHAIIDDFNKAEVIVVNTCAFIGSAKKEAIDTILEMADLKTRGACNKLIVTGCMAQKHAKELALDLPEVDAFLGVKDYERIVGVIEGLFNNDIGGGDGASSSPIILTGKFDTGLNTRRILTTPQHYAYLRVSDGCNNKCSYCTIPSIRGAYKSASIESLVDETKILIDGGAKEVILVAQDTTSFGKDIYGKPQLLYLLEKLARENIEKIRLMYCYPHLVDNALLDFIVANKKMAKYIDIPLQHVDNDILAKMNRPMTEYKTFDLVERVLNRAIALRTTLMVGFPSETDEQFNKLARFVVKYKPTHVGCFEYSRESGTGASKLKEQVKAKTKKERYNKIGELHLENVKAFNHAKLGKTLEVVYEGIDFEKGMFYGRADFSAPDVDTLVYFKGEFADVGEVYRVKVVGADGYDLVGEMCVSDK